MGLLNAAVSLDSGAVVMASSETLSEHGDGRGRALTATFYNDSVASAGISQPLTCIIEGDRHIHFYASVMARYRQRLYAQYVEDTTDFDPSGRFVDLDTKASPGPVHGHLPACAWQRIQQFVFGHQFTAGNLCLCSE